MLTSNQELHTTAVEHFSIQENVPLADKNYFGTGGNAKFYCTPTTADQFATALQFAADKQLEIFVLGGGANILISDQGFNGLVIHPAFCRLCAFPIHCIHCHQCCLVA